MKRKFKCDCCQGTFDSDWSDEDAVDEFEEVFAHQIDKSQCATLCDDCHEKIMQHAKESGLHDIYLSFVNQSVEQMDHNQLIESARAQ